MPSNRTKRTRAKQGLDYWKIDQLVTGEFLLAGVGYAAINAHGCNGLSDDEWFGNYAAIEADWHAIGADFMAWWRGDTERFTAAYASVGGKVRDPSITPWALTEFGEPNL